MTEEKPAEYQLVDEIMGAEPVEETKETPAEVPKEEPKAEEKIPEEKKVVDHGAFHEERERRKELQRKLEDESRERKKLEERFTKVLETMSQPKEEEYQDPVERLGKQVNVLTEFVTKGQQQNEQDQQDFNKKQEFFNKVRNSEAAFAKEKPDYYEAVNFLKESEIKELRLLGMNDSEIAAEINAKTIKVAERAYQQEKSPAHVGYELALSKGYKKQAPEQKKTIQDMDKSFENSRTLSPGGASESGSGIEKMSVREIDNLSDEEFDRLWGDLNKRSRK